MTIILRIVSSLAAVVLCFFLIVISLRFGISRAAGRVGMANGAISMANDAARLTPSDPDAHRAKATVFRQLRMYKNAKDELEIAVSLRPRDDYLWLELGELRDELNDQVGALSAFDQAVAAGPAAEMKRLSQNAAEGKKPNEGGSPVIRRGGRGILGSF